MKPLTSLCRILVLSLCLLAASAQAGPLDFLTSKLPHSMSDLPRYQKLPLFDPHRKSFTCVYQEQHVPPLDPQAEVWFQQALALDNPDVWYEDIDWKKVYQLYAQAAERNHWKAMLNLASLILSGYPGVPEQHPEVAILWVEKAMRLGVPDAYDMMGTYHQNGMIKGGDATSAYAFFQRAADMGSPSAMTFLGYKMTGGYDNPAEGFWANEPIGTQMLECALAQGYGDAADKLGLVYARPRTAESKLRALKVLHEGVKLGCHECASSLSVEFDGMDLSNGSNLVGYIDKARAERYGVLADALEHYLGRLKLPNLDKVLPLPPAPLPRWDGNKQTLIDAAKAVTPVPKAKPASAASLQGRAFMPDGHDVLALAQSPYAVPGDQPVPETGYWLALYGLPSTPKTQLRSARDGLPERYLAGEQFEPSSFSWLAPEQVQWHFLGAARQLPPPREAYLALRVQAGVLRQVPPPESLPHCNGVDRCPRTGIWEGHVADDQAQAVLYNQWEQQAYVEEGQPFPDPRARFPDLAREDLRWVYQGSPNAEGDAPGVTRIAL